MFKQHEVEWSDEQVRRFWDWLSNAPSRDDDYFAAVFGEQLIRLARKYGLAKRSLALDFGCGPGHLLNKLESKGFRCVGLEFSRESAAKARTRATEVVTSPSELSAGTFDFVFFIETIEHLDDNQLVASLAEIRRVLKPGGRVLITTPYREHLALGKTMCPDCGAVFHRMQHVRQWSEATIKETLECSGFRTVACWGTTLMQTAIEISLVASYRNLKSKIFGGEPLRQNLIYVGLKY